MEKYKELNESTIGSLVASDYRKAEIFKKYGLDFCCGGGKTVQKACIDKGIDSKELIDELCHVDQGDDQNPQEFNEWKLDFLSDYIVNVHHAYVAKNIPTIREFAHKVKRVHGHAQPEVVQISDLFDAISDELTQHMHKEEYILFPYIKRLAQASAAGEPISPPPFGTVSNPIKMMEHEHDNAGEILMKIQELSSNYTPPLHACTTYRVLYAKLEEFGNDLQQHIHLENNILFPKAEKLEQGLLS